MLFTRACNVAKNFNQKRNNYLPLAAELKRLYDIFNFEIIPTAIGATGSVTNDVCIYVCMYVCM